MELDVGISPGGGIGSALKLNLDHGFRTGYSNGAVFESFNPIRPFDLGTNLKHLTTLMFTPKGNKYRMTVDLADF